jgi:UDP-glucose 4-epimerase
MPYTDFSYYERAKDFIKTIKPTTIFDLAALPLYESITRPYYVAYKIYCMGLNLCELCREGYFDSIIHISSSKVFNINTPYAAAKDAQDKLIKSYVNTFGIHAKIARPFNTYGPRQTLNAVIPMTIQRILRNERPIITGDGEQKRDLVYVDDTVKGILNVWENGEDGKEYNISTGQCYSINEIVFTIMKIMDYKGEPIYKPARQGDTPIIHGEKTQDDCISLTEGLKRTVQWWQGKGYM